MDRLASALAESRSGHEAAVARAGPCPRPCAGAGRAAGVQRGAVARTPRAARQGQGRDARGLPGLGQRHPRREVAALHRTQRHPPGPAPDPAARTAGRLPPHRDRGLREGGARAHAAAEGTRDPARPQPADRQRRRRPDPRPQGRQPHPGRLGRDGAGAPADGLGAGEGARIRHPAHLQYPGRAPASRRDRAPARGTRPGDRRQGVADRLRTLLRQRDRRGARAAHARPRAPRSAPRSTASRPSPTPTCRACARSTSC